MGKLVIKIILKKFLAIIILKNLFPIPTIQVSVFTVRQWPCILVASYLAQSRTKSFYLYVKKNTTLALIAKKKLESLLIFPV